MSENPLRLQYLLHKYLHNKSSREELEELWVLMADISENDLVEFELEEIWNEEISENNLKNWDQLYSRLQKQIQTNETDYSGISKAVSLRIFKKLAIAASILICFSLPALYYFNYAVQNKSAKIAVPLQVPVKAISCQIITLPDGSVVTLNHNSHLSYPSSFTEDTRDVYLTGEAFFDIKHDRHKPFLVHTGLYIIKVLGTAFDIRSFPNEKAISVTVTRGKVQVQKLHTKKILGIILPGYQLNVSTPNSETIVDTVVQKKVDINTILAWKKEELVFDNITFDEAAMRLSYYFNIEIRFKNPGLKNCRFTGNFQEESLENTLSIITKLTNTLYEKRDNLIWIDGKGCN